MIIEGYPWGSCVEGRALLGVGGYNRLGTGDSKWASHSTTIRTVVENLADALLGKRRGGSVTGRWDTFLADWKITGSRDCLR
jgi:hypothetical protein